VDHEQNKLLLREDHIVETVAKLQRRIGDRFPESGLSTVCGQLLGVAEQASERSDWIGNPIRSIRVAGYASAVMLIGSFLAFVMFEVQLSEGEQTKWVDLVGAIDAGLNVMIFFSLAIWFLISLETRIKRRRAIAAVHELRSLAHVVDMHQLTKDPERVLREWTGTQNSPTERMTPRELNRYLDYCSEMLSLIGKIAALYVQRFDDSDAVAAVSEVEQLTTGLSRKIWQKIMILNQTRDVRLQTPEQTISSPADQPTKSQDKQAS
jgi:hypothetical protein